MMSRHFPVMLLGLFCFGLTTIRAVADPAPVESPEMNARPLTLEDQIEAVVPSWTAPHRMLIEVNTQPNLTPQERAMLTPPDPTVVPDDSSPEGVAVSNGYVPQWFGRVMAIAPPTMTVLNTDPSISELPLEQLAQTNPIPFLLASLTDAQFQLLATTGLGMVDLTPDQQELFASMIPKPFQVISADVDPPQGGPIDPKISRSELHKLIAQQQEAMEQYKEQIITVAPDDVLRSVRLHAYLNQEFDLDSPNQGSFGFTTRKLGNYSSGDKKLVSPEPDQTSSDPLMANLKGLLVQTSPNVPKTADIDWRLKSLTVVVSVDGSKTVNDLVTALSRATHLELYADASYGNDPVLVAGDLTTKQPAVSLMQALALCVCGTWRQVGSAYVLTDDVAGLGARRQSIADVVQIWSNRLKSENTATAGRLTELKWLSDLELFPGDKTDLTKDQLLAILGTGGPAGGSVTWKDLPLNVSNALKSQISAEATTENFVPEDEAAFSSILTSIKPDSHVGVTASMEIALEYPNTGSMSFSDYRFTDSEGAPGNLPTIPGKVALPGGLHGVICAAKTALEARKIVDLLAPIGIDALYIDVFNNGRTYFPNTSILPETDDAASVLSAAIDEAKTKNIKVYAVIDALCWRKDGNLPRPSVWPPQFDEDLNVFGEPSYKGVQRRLAANAIRLWDPTAAEQIMNGAGAEGWVSPMDPAVRQSLRLIVKELAVTRGLSGLVFEDTAPPGYMSKQIEDGSLDLGYTSSNRLSFLRAYHTDPVDIGGPPSVWIKVPGNSAGEMSIDLSIPGFGDVLQGRYAAAGTSAPPSPSELWSMYRAKSDLSLLTQCYSAAFNANPKLPLYMRERQQGFTIDPWTDQAKIDEVSSVSSISNPYGSVNQNSLLTYPVMSSLKSYPRSFTWLLNDWFNEIGGGKAGGVVLDLETGAAGESAPTLLEMLQSYLKPRTLP